MTTLDEQYAGIIAGFPLFQGFTIQGAQRFLERGEIMEYSDGKLLFKEGEPSTSVLLVLQGKIEVFVEREGKDLILLRAEPGTVLGELGVLCGMPRSASVRANEKATILSWNAAAFRTLLLRYPLISERIFKAALRTLAEKERSLIDSLMLTRNASGPVDEKRES